MESICKTGKEVNFFPSGSTWSKAAHIEEPPPRVQRHQEEESPRLAVDPPPDHSPPTGGQEGFFFAEDVMGAGPDLTHISADEEVTVNTRNIIAKMQ